MAKHKINSQRYNCLDLFSGAGGFSLGLHAGGFKSVGAVELDITAANTYRRNFKTALEVYAGPIDGDMRRLSAVKVQSDLLSAGIDELDLLVAGPPCQGFSRVGRGKLASLADRKSAFVKDKRNQLYKYAIDFLSVLRPRVFLFENVAGILHLGGHNMAEVVCHEAASRGYKVRCALLNSAWYGVPQTRERVFIIGFRDDLLHTPEFPPIERSVELSRGHLSDAKLDVENWQNQEYFVAFPQLPKRRKLQKAVSVAEAFEDLPPFTQHLEFSNIYRARRSEDDVAYKNPPSNEYTQLMRNWFKLFTSDRVTDHYSRHTPRDYPIFAKMNSGDKYPHAVEIAEIAYSQAVQEYQTGSGKRPRRKDFIPPYKLTGFPDKWRKLVPEQPSWTVTAHLGKDTYSHIHPDSQQARTITIREAARLQSFPDGFVFSGNIGQAFHQIGNAVPPLLAMAMGTQIKEQLRAIDLSHSL